MSVLVEFDRRGLKDEWRTERRSHEYVYNLHIYAELGYSMYSGMEHVLLFFEAIVTLAALITCKIALELYRNLDL